MALIIKSEEDETRTPHLAMTHNELQGGAANGRNVSLLMKSAEMTEAIEKALEGLGLETDVVKATYYGQMRRVLQSAVQDQFGGDGWDHYAYVEDFDDTTVVFCTEDGLFVVTYTLSDNGTVAKLDDVATPVTAEVIYTETDGSILLSEDAEDKLEEGVYTLVKSCTENPSTIEHLKKMFADKQSEVIKLNEEITKAVDAAVAVEKAAFAAQEALLKAAQDKVAEFEKAAAEAVTKARHDSLVEAGQTTESAQEIVKSLAGVADEAFAVVLKGYQLQKAAEATNPLFNEQGVNGVGEPDQEKVDKVAEILKAKYQPKTLETK